MTTVLHKKPGKQALTSNSDVLVGYDERRMAHIAREIALDILELPAILEANLVSEQEWEALRRSEAFQILLLREKEYWNSSLNTGERIRIKSLSVVEDSLLTAAKVINNEQEGAAGRARMLEAVAKIANIGERPANGMVSEGNRVVIQINMGEDKKLVKEVEVTPEVTLIEAREEAEDA